MEQPRKEEKPEEKPDKKSHGYEGSEIMKKILNILGRPEPTDYYEVL